MYNQRIDWERLLQDEFGRFTAIQPRENPRAREEYVYFIRNNRQYDADLLPKVIKNADLLLIERHVNDPNEAMKLAIYMMYFVWVIDGDKRSHPVDAIMRYDDSVPQNFIEYLLNLLNIDTRPVNPPRYGNQQPQLQGRSYSNTSSGRQAPIAPPPVQWTQGRGGVQAPFSHDNTRDTQPVVRPTQLPEAENRLVTITRQSVRFSVMPTIDKRGNTVNQEDHSKFYQDVLNAELAAPAPTGTLVEINSEAMAESTLLHNLSVPESSRLVSAIITEEREDGNIESGLEYTTWFKTIPGDVMQQLSLRKENYLYTSYFTPEKELTFLTSDQNKIKIAVKALKSASLENIDTVLSGLVDNGLVHNIEVLMLREYIVSSINSVLQTRLGLSPDWFEFDLSKYVPKDTKGYMDKFTQAIRDNSTSPIINELDIEAELNRGVTDVLQDIEVEDNKITVSQSGGVGYITVNLERFPFGEAIEKVGYVTTDISTLHEIAETVSEAICTKGEYLLMTKDGYLLSITTIASGIGSRPTSGFGKVVFIRRVGINMMAKQLKTLYGIAYPS